MVNAEQALVGSILSAPGKLTEVVDLVKAADFHTEAAMSAYAVMVSLWRQKQPVDLVTVAGRLPELTAYLAASTSLGFGPSAAAYAKQVANEGRVRRIKTAASSVASGSDPDAMLASLLALYQTEMAAGAKDPNIQAVVRRVEQHIAENKKRGSLGFQTGFQTLREMYITYQPGHIWTVGGWTSTGKTATMVQQIVNLLTIGEDPSILVISTEMTEEQVVARLVANITGVASGRILSDRFNDDDEAGRVAAAKESIAASKLLIYDDIYTLADIETAFRKAELQGGVDVGWIDYVQNCRVTDAKSQYQEQSELAKRLQALAKDVRSTIICLSQVSNDVGRGNTDNLELKGAGEWGAVSDIGVMLTRNKLKKYLMKYEIKKNRHGRLGEMGLEYKAEWTSLKEVPLNG